jgi:hypothetical protein
VSIDDRQECLSYYFDQSVAGDEWSIPYLPLFWKEIRAAVGGLFSVDSLLSPEGQEVLTKEKVISRLKRAKAPLGSVRNSTELVCCHRI